MSRNIVLIVHNLRSCHNVGSLLRTADGLGLDKVFLTGYTPYPETLSDIRLPHLRASISKKISKTALGAEDSVDWEHNSDIKKVIDNLRKLNYEILALEQTATSKDLKMYNPSGKIAIVVGREVEGIEREILDLCDQCLEITMLGKKESFNVVQAAAMALYHCRFNPLSGPPVKS